MQKPRISLLAAVLTACLLGLSALPAQAYEQSYEQGDDAAIMLDLAVLRPIGLVATIAGSVIFVASLPISIPTWSVGKTFTSFVKRPVLYTFVRDLGEPRN